MRDVQAILDSPKLSRVRDQLDAMVRPAIYIECARLNEDLPIGSSKFGGCPDLPSEFEWPTYQPSPTCERVAISLVAQIRLSDIAPFDVENKLPHNGWLWFFSDQFGLYKHFSDDLEVYSDPRGTKVLYLPDESRVLSRAMPQGRMITERPWQPRSLAFKSHPTLPSLETSWIADAGSDEGVVKLDRSEWSSYADIHHEGLIGDRHHLLGYSDDVQPRQLERGYRDFRNYLFASEPEPKTTEQWTQAFLKGRLLFEIESNDDMNFGRWGCGSFFMRDEDMKARRFDRVWFSEA